MDIEVKGREEEGDRKRGKKLRERWGREEGEERRGGGREGSRRLILKYCVILRILRNNWIFVDRMGDGWVVLFGNGGIIIMYIVFLLYRV